MLQKSCKHSVRTQAFESKVEIDSRASSRRKVDGRLERARYRAIKKRCSDLSFRPSLIINVDGATRGMRISGAMRSHPALFATSRSNVQPWAGARDFRESTRVSLPVSRVKAQHR